MKEINWLLLILLVICLIILLTIRMFNTVQYAKHTVPMIKSADINIATSKMDSLIESYKLRLGLKDWTIIYRESEEYLNAFSMINKKLKQINIPRWTMNSVGYELDYVFGSMWMCSKLINKEPFFTRLNFLIHQLYIIAMFLLLGSIIFDVIMITLADIDMTTYIVKNKTMRFLYDAPIISGLGFVGFGMMIIRMYLSSKAKLEVEAGYEKSVVKFVNDECEGYKEDISTARYYAVQMTNLLFPIFKGSKKTIDIKYLGPFVCL